MPPSSSLGIIYLTSLLMYRIDVIPFHSVLQVQPVLRVRKPDAGAIPDGVE
jgi:hypothetical protein